MVWDMDTSLIDDAFDISRPVFKPVYGKFSVAFTKEQYTALCKDAGTKPSWEWDDDAVVQFSDDGSRKVLF